MPTATITHSAVRPVSACVQRTADQADIDKLVEAFVRIRSADRLDGAIITRCWLAADMGVSVDSLDGLLKLLRWQGLIGLPNDHLVTVEDPDAMRTIALAHQVELAPTPSPPDAWH